MIEDISERLLREFAQRLQESLGATPASEATAADVTAAAGAAPAAQEIEGIGLVASVLRAQAFRNRRAIGAALLGLALFVLLRARARGSRGPEI
jgi:hypothetical protein